MLNVESVANTDREIRRIRAIEQSILEAPGMSPVELTDDDLESNAGLSLQQQAEHKCNTHIWTSTTC